MGTIGMATLALILANVLCSYRGFKNHAFFNAYKFEVGPILAGRDYKRLVTSGFLHIDWLHLGLNMYTLYAFSSELEARLGWWQFLLIYFASLIGGDLLALFIHRNHRSYSSVGASGAVSGLIFAGIALFPGMRVSLFGPSLFIPSWLFGLLFVAASIYGIRSRRDNVGHDAHLGGALVGMAVSILLRPEVLHNNLLPIVVIAVPTLVFFVIIATRPQLLLTENSFRGHHEGYSMDQKFNAEKNQKQREIDRILDKINRTGAKSLSEEEKRTLRDHTG